MMPISPRIRPQKVPTKNFKEVIVNASLLDSQAYIPRDMQQELEDKMHLQEHVNAGFYGISMNTESEEFDFAANTSEKHAANEKSEIEVTDIQRYTTTMQEKSPFQINKRRII